MKTESPLTRFSIIDTARFGLAWVVVLWHAYQISGYSLTDIATHHPLFRWMHGEQAVLCFFIISGFSVTWSVLRERETFSLRRYFFKRFFRIFPAYWLALAACTLAVLFLEGQDIPLLGWHIGTHVVMLHGLVPEAWLPGDYFALLPPAWSLSIEEQFYVLLPLLLWPILRNRHALHLVLFAVVLGIFWWLYKYVPMTRGALPRTFVYFLVGIATAFAFHPSQPSWLRGLYAGLAMAPLAVFGWAVPNLPIFFVWAFVCGVLALSQSQWQARLQPFLKVANNRITAYLGRLSYATYLFHVPVLMVVLHFLPRWVPDWASRDQEYKLYCTLAVSIPCILGVSICSYHFLEKPLIRFAEQWSLRFQK